MPDDGLGGELGFGLGVVGGEVVDDGHGGGGFGAVEVGLGEERIVGVEEPGLGLRVVGGGGGGGGAGGVEGEGKGVDDGGGVLGGRGRAEDQTVLQLRRRQWKRYFVVLRQREELRQWGYGARFSSRAQIWKQRL